MKRLLLSVAIAATLTGCSSTDVVRAPLDVSVGQQLLDLKSAHDSGALNKQEYDQQRKTLINNVR